MNRIEQWLFADEDPMDAEVQTASYDIKSVYGGGHNALYEHISSILEGRNAPVVFALEGRKTVEILEKCKLLCNEPRAQMRQEGDPDDLS
ncbi:hypothetical protein SDC9_194233 [bioreactor metagenome]|uniref:Uncharacterized protein n=1 Tax=bioreactor metagenome TaxID=1076179 RepID=A0A645I783_9ZZZZ